MFYGFCSMVLTIFIGCLIYIDNLIFMFDLIISLFVEIMNKASYKYNIIRFICTTEDEWMFCGSSSN